MLSCSPAPVRKNCKYAPNGGQNIKVFVRVKPMTESDSRCCIECPPTNRDIVVHERLLDKFTKKFSFDRVFPTKSKQIDVYKSVAKPLVDEVLQGFNCTIFAYGQTGTGKTYTMEGGFCSDGAIMDENHGAGIIPRCVNQLFDELRIQKLEFTMRVSFLELYNEEVFDLLSAHDDLSKLRLYEDAQRKGSCIIQGLEEVLVRNKSDVYSIIEKGSAKRQTAATLMNAHSSRSHTVFTVTVHMKENTVDGDELVKTGKLHLVDLAGSENIGRSGAVEKRAREAGNINQSLLTLGRVITSLVEKTPHIPYRESKLTRLLQDALGGRTKTSIIATVSPASINLEETLSTLDYACRAKNIQNRPEVNQKLNKKELIGEYTNEIEKLRRDLLAAREKSGVYLANENYQDMMETMEKQTQEIAEKIAQMRNYEEQLEKQLALFSTVQEDLERTTSKLNDAEQNVIKTKDSLKRTEKCLARTATERDEQSHLVSAHAKTESELQVQARNLMNVTQITTNDVRLLQDKLDRKRKVEAMNENLGLSFEKGFEENLSAMQSSISAFKHHHKKTSDNIVNGLGDCMQSSLQEVDEVCEMMKLMKSQINEVLKQTSDFVCGKLSENRDTSCSFASDVETRWSSNQQNLENFFQQVFQPFVDTLSQGLRVQHKKLDQFMDDYVDKFQILVELCQSSHLKEIDILSSMEKSLADIEVTPSMIDKCLQDKAELMQRQIKSKSQKLKDIANMLLMETENTEKELLADFPILSPENAQKFSAISTLSQKMQREVVELRHISTQHQSTSNEKQIDFEQIVRSDINTTKGEVEVLTGKIADLAVKVAENATEQATAFESAMNKINIFKENKFKDGQKEEDNIKNNIDVTSNQTEKQLESSLHQLQTSTEQSQLAITDQQQKLSHLDSELEEFLIDHNEQIKDSGDAIHEFFVKQAKDVPTGMTPNRTEYSYPQSLSATSPHERILMRYRKSKANDSSNKDINGSFISEETDLPASETSIKSNSSAELEKTIDSEFVFPAPPTRQDSNEDMPRPSSSLSRSSSTNSIPENSKENRSSSRNRGLKPPSKNTSKIPNQEVSTRPRKILGSYN